MNKPKQHNSLIAYNLNEEEKSSLKKEVDALWRERDFKIEGQQRLLSQISREVKKLPVNYAINFSEELINQAFPPEYLIFKLNPERTTEVLLKEFCEVRGCHFWRNPSDRSYHITKDQPLEARMKEKLSEYYGTMKRSSPVCWYMQPFLQRKNVNQLSNEMVDRILEVLE